MKTETEMLLEILEQSKEDVIHGRVVGKEQLLERIKNANPVIVVFAVQREGRTPVAFSFPPTTSLKEVKEKIFKIFNPQTLSYIKIEVNE